MPTPDTPLVTAIIPVFNGERFLAVSVASVLGQTFRDLECVVVDDGSTDGTPEIMAGFDDPRVRYLRQTNRGVSGARNAGLAAARGEFVAFLDADDVWLPEKIERQVRGFEGRPELGLLITGYTIVDEALRPRVTIVPDRDQLDLRRLLMLEASGIGLSFTAMVRTELARAVRFDETLSTGADLQFALGVRQRSDVDALLEPLVMYRVHVDQMHLDLAAFERDTCRMYEQWFAPDMPYARHRRRAYANLYTRLFFYELSHRHPGRALRALRIAASQRPDRIVRLPAWAAALRVRRRLCRSVGAQCEAG